MHNTSPSQDGLGPWLRPSTRALALLLAGWSLSTFATPPAKAQTATAARVATTEISSPDSRISTRIMAAADAPLRYSISLRGQSVVAPSDLGITIDGKYLGQDAVLGRATTRTVRETYATRGAHTQALNFYRETLIPVASAGQNWQLEVRAFNDGVALRYRVPGSGARRINGESTQWSLPPQSLLWHQRNTNEYEGDFREQQASEVPSGTKVGAPITAKLPNGLGYALITEANLVNYSDMALQSGAASTWSAVFDKDSAGWTAQGEIVSPWRVTLLAPNLNALVNSDILTNLCPAPPAELANAKWIQPGRSNWHWMVTGRPRLEAQRQWVDWTKQLGFEYYLIDDGWVDWRDGNRDQWACIKDIVDYARGQNVRIWAWVHSKELRDAESREAYFQKAKAAGIVGLKIDFPERPGVNWVNWYDDTLRDLARFELMVDFHGAVKPSGRERTWPHELTREAIFGRESGKLPALHDTALPFTRYVQGHADFTPVEFRASKLGGGSWAHELAQAIIYTSPFLCYGGDPVSYLENPALSVLKAIPATWDETIVLPGSEVGRTAIYARRKGSEWFVGAISGNDPRPLSISLGFLGRGSFRAEILADNAERNDAWSRSQRVVSSRDTLASAMRRNGGFVARLSKIR